MARQRISHGATIDTVTRDEVAELLQEFGRAGHIAWGSNKIEREVENWPVMGHRRQIRVATGRGSDNLILAASGNYVDLVDQNAGRGGLSVINIGANPCFVYLSTAAEAAAANNQASGYLFPNGTWDGKIGDAQWVGAVSLRCPLGTTLVWAEL